MDSIIKAAEREWVRVNVADATRCQAINANGARCKRNVSDNDDGLCGHHYKAARRAKALRR